MTVANLRIELGDTDTALPVMSDSEYQYFLDKNSGSMRRAAMDAAKSIIFKLSMRTDETEDIFSIKGSSASKSYMQALKMYISNPDMNPVYNNAMPYAGGISLADMDANNANSDNNVIVTPSESQSALPTNFFEV